MVCLRTIFIIFVFVSVYLSIFDRLKYQQNVLKLTLEYCICVETPRDPKTVQCDRKYDTPKTVPAI